MICPTCGAENSPDARFCASCSLPLETRAGQGPGTVYCTNCGAENHVGSAYCSSCQEPFDAPTHQPGSSVPTLGPLAPEYIGIWIRSVALVIDVVIVTIVSSALAFITAGAGAIFALPLVLAYFAIFTARSGQTIGKKVMHIQVVTGEGECPTGGRAAIREGLGKTLPWIFPPLALAHLWAAIDPNKQSLFDKLARTYVVRKP